MSRSSRRSDIGKLFSASPSLPVPSTRRAAPALLHLPLFRRRRSSARAAVCPRFLSSSAAEEDAAVLTAHREEDAVPEHRYEGGPILMGARGLVNVPPATKRRYGQFEEQDVDMTDVVGWSAVAQAKQKASTPLTEYCVLVFQTLQRRLQMESTAEAVTLAWRIKVTMTAEELDESITFLEERLNMTPLEVQKLVSSLPQLLHRGNLEQRLGPLLDYFAERFNFDSRSDQMKNIIKLNKYVLYSNPRSFAKRLAFYEEHLGKMPPKVAGKIILGRRSTLLTSLKMLEPRAKRFLEAGQAVNMQIMRGIERYHGRRFEAFFERRAVRPKLVREILRRRLNCALSSAHEEKMLNLQVQGQHQQDHLDLEKSFDFLTQRLQLDQEQLKRMVVNRPHFFCARKLPKLGAALDKVQRLLAVDDATLGRIVAWPLQCLFVDEEKLKARCDFLSLLLGCEQKELTEFILRFPRALHYNLHTRFEPRRKRLADAGEQPPFKPRVVLNIIRDNDEKFDMWLHLRIRKREQKKKRRATTNDDDDWDDDDDDDDDDNDDDDDYDDDDGDYDEDGNEVDDDDYYL